MFCNQTNLIMNNLEFIKVDSTDRFSDFLSLYEMSTRNLSLEEINKFQDTVLDKSSITTILLAKIGWVCIGFSILIESYSTTLLEKTYYLEEFYILKSYRSQWYGTIFFNYLQSYAKNNHIARIEWSTGKDNTKAQKFYSQYAADDNWLFYKLKIS